MIIDKVLENNQNFVENFEGEELGHLPKMNLCIVTCMDTRLTNFLEPALGIDREDAKIIRNAGNTIVGEDVIRSVAAAVYSLGCEEVMVIGHTNCGMKNANVDKIKSSMIEKGVPEEEINKVDLSKWIGSIEDEEINVIETVKKIKEHPLIADGIIVHGLIVDIVTGELKVLVKG
ncbi:MAG: carbonic anhydrase [Methanobacteriaceae archaeon]|jgi:carbonic anhydrase|uniref:beta-class carbonic anhydrase n=1 Tax=Methanobrevibacter TaxID=2172 RepID=UPI003758EED2|nr:carbonic anhydrase [Methanobacteriaceae archaeon]MDD4593921.1 carbonic anhydrase [Methanobacteriaceae archaeon]